MDNMFNAGAGNSKPERYWQKTYRLIDDLRMHLSAIPKGELESLMALFGSKFAYLRRCEDDSWIAAFYRGGKAIEAEGFTAEKALTKLIVAHGGAVVPCLVCEELKPLILDRRGRSVCEDCYVYEINTRANTRAGAKPATSQADHDGEALGRTGDSISPTGAKTEIDAVNSHDELTAALKSALKVIETANIAGQSLYGSEVANNIRRTLAVSSQDKQP